MAFGPLSAIVRLRTNGVKPASQDRSHPRRYEDAEQDTRSIWERSTGIAVGYNVGQAPLGGTAPLVAASPIRLTGNNLAPTWRLIACAAIAGPASLFIPARHGRPPAEPSDRPGTETE